MEAAEDAVVVTAPPTQKPPEAPPNTPDAALARVERQAVEIVGGAVMPKNLDESLRVAKWAVESGLLPQDVKTVAAAWAVMQRGAELGFTPLGSFDFLYVVSGRVRMTPNAIRAKALASGLVEDMREEIIADDATPDNRRARVTVKRKGLPTPVVREFSMLDAKRAHLLGKGDRSAWTAYPDRMLLARARGFALGDCFSDLCGGLQIRERFDLEPGEALGVIEPELKAATRTPPTEPDPLIAALAAKPSAETAPPPGEPDFSRPPSEQPEPAAVLDSQGRLVLESDENGPVVVAKARKR